MGSPEKKSYRVQIIVALVAVAVVVAAISNWDKILKGFQRPEMAVEQAAEAALLPRPGNVWERCSDLSDFDKDYYSTSPSVDPKGPPTGFFRCLRGGSWLDPEHALCCS